MLRFLLFIAAALLAASPAWALTPAQRVVLFSGGGGIYTIVSSNENAGDQAGSGPDTTTVTLPQVVAGDTVFIEGGYCQSTSACTGSTDDFGAGSASGSAGLGTCVKSSNQNVTADALITFQFACPVTSSAANITISVTNNNNSQQMFFVQIAAQDVHSAIGWSGTPDQGLGKNTYSASANTAPSVSSGTPVPVPSLAISNAFLECGTYSPGAGWTTLAPFTFIILAQYKIPTSTGAVTATASNPGSCGNNIQVDIYK